MLVGPKEANVKEESKSEEGKKRQVGQLGHVQQLKKKGVRGCTNKSATGSKGLRRLPRRLMSVINAEE